LDRNSRPPIDVVFFDLGSVLVDLHLDRFVNQIAKTTGIHPNSIFEWIRNNPEFHKSFERGLIDKKAFFRQVNQHFDNKLDYSFFVDAYVDIFTLNEKLVEIAEKISREKIISIISNTDELHFEFLFKKYPVLKIFQEPITSFQTHYLKPEKEIYLYALNKFKALPEQALFVDDLEDNVRGAKAVGMQAIQYEDETSEK